MHAQLYNLSTAGKIGTENLGQQHAWRNINGSTIFTKRRELQVHAVLLTCQIAICCLFFLGVGITLLVGCIGFGVVPSQISESECSRAYKALRPREMTILRTRNSSPVRDLACTLNDIKSINHSGWHDLQCWR